MIPPMLLFTWLAVAVSADTGEGEGQSPPLFRTHRVAPAGVYLLPLSLSLSLTCNKKAPGQRLQLQAFSRPAGPDTGRGTR